MKSAGPGMSWQQDSSAKKQPDYPDLQPLCDTVKRCNLLKINLTTEATELKNA